MLLAAHEMILVPAIDYFTWENKMKLSGKLVCIGLLLSAWTGAHAQQPALQQAKKLAFNAKIQFDDQAVSAASARLAPAAALVPNGGYATVKYSIGTSDQKKNLQGLIDTIAKALPEQLGNSVGTYTVTLTMTDLAGTTLVKEPILSFQWTKEKVFLFIDKTVSEARKTNWSGTLVNQMPITDSNQRLKFSVEVYAQKDRSLDFELLKKTAKTFSDGALAGFFPLPAAALPILGSVTDLINSLYSNSTKRNLVDQDELVMEATKKPIIAPISFEDFDDIPVLITIETAQSRFAADFADGKFKSKPDEAIFSNAGMALGGTKPVGIVELISTSTEPKLKSTRTLLDAVISGGTYGKDPSNKKEDNVGALCANLYDALNLYLSKYDARAMFWIFIKRYGDSLNKTACLGSRQAALTEVGLSLD
jgi:hypothetical protein